MNFSIPQKTFAGMFSVCKASADHGKSPAPVLSQVRVYSTGEKIVMEANDLQTAIRMEAPATIHHPGDVLLPRDFGERVDAMPVGDIRIAHIPTGQHQVELSSLVSERKFLVSVLVNVSTFPFPNVVTDRPEEVFPIATLLHVLDTVKHTVLMDDTKPKMSSILLRWAWGELEAMSCDGHRFTRMFRPMESVSTTGQIMIPHGLLAPLLSALEHGMKNGEKDCTLRFSKSQINLQVGTTQVFSKLTEEDPLPIEDAIPKEWGTYARMDRVRFLDAVKAIDATRIGSVRFILKNGQDKLFMFEEDAQSGDAADEVSAEIVGPKWSRDEKERVVKLDARYVRVALEKMDAEDVVFAFTPVVGKVPQGNPALIAPAADLPSSPKETKHIVGIMPMVM
jgi:DNA polymerase III sliding clamp (beta) subunit (PCNA family)